MSDEAKKVSIYENFFENFQQVLEHSIRQTIGNEIRSAVRDQIKGVIKQEVNKEIKIQVFTQDGRIRMALAEKILSAVRFYIHSELRKDLIWNELSEKTRDDIVKKLLD